MDPLSLIASILTIVGVGAQTIKLLQKVASLKTAPLLALALNNELSDLRLNVLAIENLFSKQSKVLASCSDQDAARDHSTIASVISCLERCNDLVIKVNGLLGPLLNFSLRSDVAAPKKWIKWFKEERKLTAFKQDLRTARISLNTALGVLGLSTAIRLEALSYSLCNGVTKIQENQGRTSRSSTQDALRLEPVESFIEPTTRKQIRHQQISVGQGTCDHAVAIRDQSRLQNMWKPSPLSQNQATVTTVSATYMLDRHNPVLPLCNCCCHDRYSERSPRVADKIFGTLFTGYSGIPYLTRKCDESSCAQSCSWPHATFSLTYFFPMWFLSYLITLAVKQHSWGFDYNLRFIHYVGYSSLMFQYAYQGNVPGMKSLIKSRLGSPFEVTSERQRSLLGVAASRGHGEICEILLHAGADPFLVDYKNRSAIDIAWEALLTNKKHAKKLKSLLALTSHKSYVSKHNLGLLHKSVLGLDHLNVKLLLEQSPDYAIDEKDVNGQTALYWAALRADIQATTYLLRAGADANIKNNRGAGILTAALMSSDASCVQEILGYGCEVNYTDGDGYIPLHHSCRYGLDVGVVKALLDRGADKNAKTMLGHSPLMIATFNKCTAIAKFLIDSQVDLDMQCKDGGYALKTALMVGDYDTVSYLLEHHANHRLKTKANETLLHFAAYRHGDQKLIRTLEQFSLKGIDIEEKGGPRKQTPLQVAEMHRDCDPTWLAMFKALLLNIRFNNFSEKCASREYVDASEYLP